MKIIISRKGFDSTSGGTPSPIFSDGRMLSLPIPDKYSPIRYDDIKWQERSLGSIVSNLTGGRVPASHFAHIDPDLNAESLSRSEGWKPLFGQTGAAQGHLRNNNVAAGDVFLFFGLFRNVVQLGGKLDWDSTQSPRHVIWGWLQVDHIIAVDDCDRNQYKWALKHPHFHRGVETNNTIYVGRIKLSVPGYAHDEIAGAGIFPRFLDRLQLTAPGASAPSLWHLPNWCYPRNGVSPLTYHGHLGRWQRLEHGTQLSSVARGQEFILNCRDYPESIEWLIGLLAGSH